MVVACEGAKVTVVRPPAVGSGTGPGSSTPTYFITLNRTALTLSVGFGTQLTATVRDTTGQVAGLPVAWRSGNPAIVSVDSGGQVTGVSVGSSGVTATVTVPGGVSATATITVSSVSVASVQVMPAAASVQLGTTLPLSATPRDTTGSALIGRVVAWSSSSPTVAGVDSSGLVAALAVGGATISATSEGQIGTAAVTVINVLVASVQVAPTTTTLPIGGTTQLTATPLDAGNNPLSGRTIAWASSNAAVATVNGGGFVTAVGLGSTSITATSEGQSGSAGLTVANVPVASVQVAPASASIQVGATTQLAATPRDSNGTALFGRVVTWGSANPAIATVSGSGLVSGVAVGATTITATSEGQSGSAAITVTNPPPTLVRVILTPDTVTLLTGATRQFTASGRMSDSTTVPLSATFSATGGMITGGGFYTAGATAGAFRVIATAQGRADTSAVTIVRVPVATVVVNPATIALAPGGTAALTATPRDSAGNPLGGRVVTWSSGNVAVATVTGAGVVTAVAVGVATITATSEGQSGSAAVSVIVAPVATLQINPSSAGIPVGTSTQLTAIPRDSAGAILTGRVVTWSSSNTAIARVDTTGLAFGVSPGLDTVTALSEGKSAISVLSITGTLAGNPVPDGNDRIMFDMRAGGAFDLAQYATKAALQSLWDGGQNGSWTVVTDFDGVGQHAIRMDWTAWGGTCRDQEVIMIRSLPSPKPTEVYFQFKIWLGRTPTGGGNGLVGSYQLTNPNCGTGGNAGNKRFMWLRDGVGGGSTGRFEHLWPGPSPSNADITSDDLVLHYDFSPPWNAQTQVGVVITETIYFKAETAPGANNGIIRVWINGVQYLNRTNVPALPNAVDRFQFPTVFNSPFLSQSEYWYDIVVWQPVP